MRSQFAISGVFGICISWGISILCAAEKESEQLVFGTHNFLFYRILDSKSEPVRALNGEALYEGFGEDRGEKIRSVTTLKSLERIQRLASSVPASEIYRDAKSFQVKFSPKLIESSLQFLKNNPEALRRLLQGGSASKAKLIRGFLFGDALELSPEDFETMGQGAFSTRGEWPRFMVILSIKGLDVLLDWLLDIYVSHIRFEFSEKHMIFDPESNSVRFILHVKRTKLQGLIHRVGRLRGLPIEYFNVKDAIQDAEVDPFTISFSIGLSKTSAEYWKAGVKEPVRMKMDQPKGGIRLSLKREEGGKIINDKYSFAFSPATIQKIEETLHHTIDGSFGSFYFPEEVGTRWLIKSAPYELSDGRTQYELRLADFKIVPSGVQLGFDSYFHIYELPSCVKGLQWTDRRLPVEPVKLSNETIDHSAWEMKSTWNEQLVNLSDHFTAWKLTDSEDQKPAVDAEITERGLDFLARSAMLGGLYCVSTRAIWPRAPYMPLMEFQPTQLPELNLSDKGVSARVQGEILIKKREFSAGKDGFVLKGKISAMDWRVGFGFDAETRKIRWALPDELKFGQFSEEENRFIQRLGDVAAKLALGLDVRGEAFLSSDILRKVFPDAADIHLAQLKINDQALNLKFNLDPLKWLGELLGPHPDRRSAVETPDLGVSLHTVFVEDLPTKVSTPFMEVRWKPQNQLMFSWRYKHRSEDQWQDWTPFQSEDRAAFWLAKPGRYEFQVKSMNRSFELESSPAVYEFDYEPAEGARTSNEASETKPTQESPSRPLENVKDVSPEPHRVSAKGMFGCSLGEGTFKDSMALVWWGLLALLILIGLRHRLPICPKKSQSS